MSQRQSTRRPQDPTIRISKALSYTLRHGAIKENLPITPTGYVSISALLAHPKFAALALTHAQLLAIVKSSDKQRYALSEDGLSIRATQGHSLECVQLDLAPWDASDTVVHGTFYGAYELILQSGGLKRMGRHHVHFAVEREWKGAQGVVSGMRNDAEVVFYVDAKRAAEEGGAKWWRSENGVVLTEGVGEDGLVDLKWVMKVEDRMNGLGTLWEGGQVVVELPERLRGREVARGKEHMYRGRGQYRGRRGGRDGRGGRGRGRGEDKSSKPVEQDIAELEADA